MKTVKLGLKTLHLYRRHQSRTSHGTN